MPGFDRTGPGGEGPRTGRGLGKCNPGKDRDLINEDDDQRAGRGRGLRPGSGWWKGRNPGAGQGRRSGLGSGQRSGGRGTGRGYGSGTDFDQ